MKRTHLQLAVGLVISLGCLYFAFRGVSMTETLQALRQADARFLAAAFLFYGLGYVFRTLRWKVLLQPVKRVSLATLAKVLLVGFAANNFLPFRLGEVLRAHLCGRQFGLSRVTAFGSIVIERLTDMVSFIVAFALAAWVYPFPAAVRQAAWSMGAIALALIGALFFSILFQSRCREWLRRAPLLSTPWKHRLDALYVNFMQGVSGMMDLKTLSTAVALSLGAWWVEGTFIYLVTCAFPIPFEYPQAFFILFFLAVAVALPQAPGYVGTMEFFGGTAMALLGHSKELGLSVILAVHGLQFLFLAVVGLTAWALLGMAPRQLLNLEKASA